MLVYKGKYNVAKIMIDSVEEGLISQVYSFLNHPAFKGKPIVIMPDCHVGSGSCIGFTMPMNEYIIPNVIGVDIGCSVDSYNMGKLQLDDRDLGAFHNWILKNIPSGFHVRNTPVEIDHDFEIKVIDISDKLGLDYDRVKNAIGSLGSGNHFLELDKDPYDNIWITIHSGSRNFGLQIAKYHQNKAKHLMNKMFIGDAYRGLEFLPMDEGGTEYIEDMKVAQQYAYENRMEMACLVLEYFDVKALNFIKTTHNYINFKDNIIRKGAISAHKDERVLIPLNMRDGVIVGRGKGNADWNYSAPHGAGRVLSRTKARESITLEEMKADMEGIFSKSLNKGTIDEAPGAYKKAKHIIDAIGDTVDIDFIMKPIFNFKG